jgi:hypothetical protein
MKKLQLSPQQAWLSLKDFWAPFSFLLVKGASAEQIEKFEAKEEVILQERVKDLISINSAFDIPSGYFSDFSAEVTLFPIQNWLRFDHSEINTIMEDPDWWPAIFKENNLPSSLMKDYIVIGSNPWAADYGYHVFLHQDSNTVYSLIENIPEIELLGDIVNWLGQYRLNNFKNVKEYVDKNNNATGCEGGKEISRKNRFYLDIEYPDALARWNSEEEEFIKTFDKIAEAKVKESKVEI